MKYTFQDTLIDVRKAKRVIKRAIKILQKEHKRSNGQFAKDTIKMLRACKELKKVSGFKICNIH